ncbi:hypothetical protein, partial [Bacillus timonensis]|uniref:hypothetical protein n=1 Tax=Bacillus timonensis TaxID=1033734 RepID=UPI001A952983
MCIRDRSTLWGKESIFMPGLRAKDHDSFYGIRRKLLNFVELLSIYTRVCLILDFKKRGG